MTPHPEGSRSVPMTPDIRTCLVEVDDATLDAIALLAAIVGEQGGVAQVEGEQTDPAALVLAWVEIVRGICHDDPIATNPATPLA
jgi:hypothetical protein